MGSGGCCDRCVSHTLCLLTHQHPVCVEPAGLVTLFRLSANSASSLKIAQCARSMPGRGCRRSMPCVSQTLDHSQCAWSPLGSSCGRRPFCDEEWVLSTLVFNIIARGARMLSVRCS